VRPPHASIPRPDAGIPLIRKDRPVDGLFVHRQGEQEKHAQAQGNARLGHQREAERQPLAAHQHRQHGGQREPAHRGNPEQRPAPVELLHGQVLVAGQGHLVRQFEQVGQASRHHQGDAQDAAESDESY
jgi:hypothetical protein